MKQTANYGLKKPEGTDVVNIEDFNSNADIVDTQLKNLNDNKVAKVQGKQLSTEDYSTAEKQKLAGLNNYSHPNAHGSTMITMGDGKTLEQYKGDITASLAEKATKLTNVITLKATGWVNKTQTINLSTIKNTSLLWVTPVPGNLKSYSESMVYASSQANGCITFVCDTIPVIDLDVTIVNGGDV